MPGALASSNSWYKSKLAGFDEGGGMQGSQEPKHHVWKTRQITVGETHPSDKEIQKTPKSQRALCSWFDSLRALIFSQFGE